MDPIIKRASETQKFYPVYVLFGEDVYGIHQAKNDLISVITRTYSGADVNRYNPKNDQIQEVLAGISMLSMFSNTRIIVVEDFNGYSTKEQEEFFGTICQSQSVSKGIYVPEGTYVIVMYEEKFFSSKKVDGKVVASIEFKKKYERDAVRFINEKCREYNIKIDYEASNLLVEYLGTDYQMIESEIEKIITYIGKDTNYISVSDVEKVTSRISIDSVFALCDHLSAGNKEGALSTLNQLIDSGETVHMLIGMLTSHMRSLCITRDLLDAKLSSDALEKELSQVSKSSFRVKKFVDQAKKVSKNGLKYAISSLSELDFVIKRGQMAPELAMEITLINIAGNING